MEARANGDEINVKTLVPATIFAKAVAAKIFEIYPPALFVWRIAGKVVLRDGRSLAKAGDVLPDLKGEIVYVVRVQKIVFV